MYPVLFLYNYNFETTKVSFFIRPLLVSVITTIILIALTGLFFKSVQKAGIFVSIFSFLFFSYGHIVAFLNSYILTIRGLHINTSLFIFLFIYLVIGLSLLALYKSNSHFKQLTEILFLFSFCLVLFQILKFSYTTISAKPVNASNNPPTRSKMVKKTPDIYYIILDGYARSDILTSIYNYDNSSFLRKLQKKGFYIASKSTSNYGQTLLSLTSSLNLDYIQNFFEINPSSQNRNALAERLFNNKLFQYLKPYGYKIVAFASGYSLTEFTKADTYIIPPMTIDEFSSILLSKTLLGAYSRNILFDFHRNRITFILDHLPQIKESDSPKFVFAHVISPHPPFVFDKNGEAIVTSRFYSHSDGSHLIGLGGISQKEYITSYRAQLEFISNQILIVIDKLLKKYDKNNQPIVIIQGDHGPGSGLDQDSVENTNLQERFSILNAYYLPGLKSDLLTPNLTPVNSFRLILSEYFNIPLPALPNKNYGSTWPQPYNFIDITPP